MSRGRWLRAWESSWWPVLQGEMRRIGCRAQLDGTVPGFLLRALLRRRRREDREVPLEFRTRVPLPVRVTGRQHHQIPWADGEFRQSDLHTEQTLEYQVELVERVRVQARTGRPRGQPADIDQRVLGGSLLPVPDDVLVSEQR